MTGMRLPLRDPRTVAREIPGLLDGLFPQLAPGVVMHLNNGGYEIPDCRAVDERLIDSSPLQHAMLFELAFSLGEQLVEGSQEIDWDEVMRSAVQRQRKHFDARVPRELTDVDREIAWAVGSNLAAMVRQVSKDTDIKIRPYIHGFQWIASGAGDFSFDRSLVEVKCSIKRFGASDYRQVLMYWLLSYAAALEGRGEEWQVVVLLNPRTNLVVEITVNDLLHFIAAGRSKIELLELFKWVVGDFSARAVDHL